MFCFTDTVAEKNVEENAQHEEPMDIDPKDDKKSCSG